MGNKTLSWNDLNNRCRQLLKVDLAEIEQHPRHLVMMGVLPRLDLTALARVMTKRHPDAMTEGVALADIVEREYGSEAVAFVEKYAMNIEREG